MAAKNQRNKFKMADSKPSTSSDSEIILFGKFDESLRKVEKIIEPMIEKPLDEILGKLQAIDRAKLDVTMAFVLNSLFWIYLVTIGEDPEEHKIDYGLERIRKYMNTVDEIVAKEKAPQLDVDAAKRFLRASLSTPKDKKNIKHSTTQSPSLKTIKKRNNKLSFKKFSKKKK